MAYIKQTWANGDVVTASKLNHIEDGIAAGGGLLIFHDVDGTLDHTWQEIHDAGLPVFIGDTPDGDGTRRTWDTYISATDDPSYIITIDGVDFTTSSADGYPILQQV